MTMRKFLKLIRYVLVTLALVALLTGIRSSRERDASAQAQALETEPDETSSEAASETALAAVSENASETGPQPLSIADRTDHPALLYLMEDGAFHPERALTWGEFVRAVGVLVDGLSRPASTMWLSEDGLEGTYRGVSGLTRAGILDLQGQFRPKRAMTRDDLAQTLDRLGLQMEGEEQVLVRAIATAVAQGAMLGGEEVLDGTQAVTRREAAVVLVRLAGREPESEGLFAAGLLPKDVGEDDWTWPFIADACLAGEIPVREPGIFRMYGWLYKADENGALVKDETDGVWTFGPDGRYTTGDAALDATLANALEVSGANDLTGRAALEAVYLYVKNNFSYKVTPEDTTPETTGSTGWEFARATRFFSNGGGTCYGYAATFGLLARALGENAHIVAARVNEHNAPHSFVVIQEDGVDWIYDVELEDARPYRHKDLALFHIQNFKIYNYWYNPSW